MQTVFASRTAAEARLIAGVLESEGIVAVVQGEPLAGCAGEVPLDQAWPQVQVDDADVERARAILADLESAEPSAEAWACTSCGESHAGDFDACWKCGTERG